LSQITTGAGKRKGQARGLPLTIDWSASKIRS
jgi:hypothetical protein